MTNNELIEEQAFFDAMAAREAALAAAVGSLTMDNLSRERLEVVAASPCEILSLAARIVLYRRRT